jgi:RNA polymerase sigma factor (sigma-70 family)
MGNEQESLLTESEWRKDALRWFVAHGVEPNLAEDLAQETLLRLLRCQRRQQAITRAYLHRTCQSVLCDHKRRCERELPLLSLDVCCLCAVAERGYEQVEIQLLLEQALAQLKPLARAIVERHYLWEQTFDAIGKELGIPTERVKKICQRSIKKLQQWAQSGVGGGNSPETLSLIGDAERYNRWRWLNGKRASDGTRSSATVLAARHASSVGSVGGIWCS